MRKLNVEALQKHLLQHYQKDIQSGNLSAVNDIFLIRKGKKQDLIRLADQEGISLNSFYADDNS